MDCSTMSGDEIVITGITGRFPDSENIEVFKQKLLNQENCIIGKTSTWKTGNLPFPEKNGQIIDVDKFDTQSFGIHKKFAEYMDPLMKILIQGSYEVVADAGINPRSLRGKKVAVFAGTGIAETEQTTDYNPNESTLLGNGKTMFANRISFFLGLQGPSCNFNSLDTSSAIALEKGYLAIKSGEVESAIIATGNLSLHPHLSFQFLNLGLLSPDGLTKSFDEKANGFTRSEAVVLLFLQKARDAKRIYAEIKNIHSDSGPSYEQSSVLYPTCEFQNQLMKMTLKECSLSGKDIGFVEADGLALKAADAEEIKAIDQVYNEGRKTPLLIGYVKSNIGSCFAANTLVSIIKVIMMFESDQIPPNLHYENPSEQISAIQEGRIKVVTELTPWNGEYAAVNTTSLGGGFATVILKTFRKKKKNILHPTDNLPRLTMVSGVTEDAINILLDYMESKPVNSEMFQLINDLFEVENISHLYRGYTLLPPCGLVASKYRGIEFVTGLRTELWYVFSGMGSQWIGMGKSLMNWPLFAQSVQKCDAVLKPHGIDIVHIITTDDPKIFDNIIHSFVGIITIQIGLVDILNYLGIKPDFIIGHSVGELGCAYADGCLTAEQAVLNAMFRGFASMETEMIRGSMAAVGLGYESVKPLCPPDIDVACHNSSSSSTISGPEDSMKTFISTLQAKEIFAKEVPSCNIAYHSRYIAPAGKKLIEYLRKVVPDSKERSPKWKSTSVPKDEWETERGRFSSAEYYTNNLLSPVLFEEVSKMIPGNAITIEIAPHGLLQAILKRSLPATVINLTLTKRDHPNNIELMMDAIGKLYINSGFRAPISRLYPKIKYPVSLGTPSISSLIRWNHSALWSKSASQMLCMAYDKGEEIFKIDLKDEAWKYLRGNKIGNEIYLPCTLYLKLVLSIMKTFDKSEKPITFKNVVMHKHQCIDEDEVSVLTLMVQRGSGRFEATIDGSLLCTGFWKKNESFEPEQLVIQNINDKLNEELREREIYNQLLLRGYQYSEPFKSICKFNPASSYGYVTYQDEWELFLDGMLQMYMLQFDITATQLPLKIREITIDLESYRKQSKLLNALPVIINEQYKSARSYGIEFHDIQLQTIKQDSNITSLSVDEVKLALNFEESGTSPTDFAKMILQLLTENNTNGNIIHLIEEKQNTLDKSQKSWQDIFNETPEIYLKFRIVSSSLVQSNNRENIAVQVFFDLTTFTKSFDMHSLQEGDFLSVILDSSNEKQVLQKINILDLGIVLYRRLATNQIGLLLRKKRILKNTFILESAENNFVLTDQIKKKVSSSRLDRIIFSTKYQNSPSIQEFLNFLSKEGIEDKVRYFEILDSKAPKISLEDPIYKTQLQLDLKFNILTQDGKWGSRRLLSIREKRCDVLNSVAIQSCPGDLDSIDWVEQSLENDETGKLIKVDYSTINSYDVLIASKQVNLNRNDRNCKRKRIKRDVENFGLEYVGTNAKGERVMGISGSGTLCSFTSPDAELMWKVPKEWTSEEAATVPLAYATAFMALHMKGEIRRYNSILIHDSSSALGQALITLALNEKVNVFSTYRTEKEKEFLQLQFPSLNEDKLFCLTDPFEDKILLLTKSKGIDVIIYNGYNMDKLEIYLACVQILGRVIIIGELQEAEKKSVGMFMFLKEVGLYSVVPHNLVNLDSITKRKLSSLMKDGIAKGTIKPLFSNSYLRGELKKAFLDAQRNICYGKIVIKVQPIDKNVESLVIPCFSCLKNRSYLLLINNYNNLFGVKMIDFLIEHGAKYILVASETRNDFKGLYHFHLQMWQENEAKVVFRDNLNLSEHRNVKALLTEASQINPIDAIFDLQGMESLSQNSLFANNSITKNLFEESNKLCVELRQFVVFRNLKHASDNMNSYLFKENKLMTLSDKISEKGVPARLILWDRIDGMVESKLSDGRKNNLLTIPQCIQDVDRLMALPSANIFVSDNLMSRNRNKKITVVEEKSERELFEDYIFNRSTTY